MGAEELGEGKEVSVWTIDGYEGRFLRWESGEWRAFEHHNYRHHFSPPQPLSVADIRALREAYPISEKLLGDLELIRTAPNELERLAARQPR